MKVSLILIVAIFLNTTIILAEPLSTLIKDLNYWPFIVLEAVLLVGFYINHQIKELQKICVLDFNNLNVFVVKNPYKEKENGD